MFKSTPVCVTRVSWELLQYHFWDKKKRSYLKKKLFRCKTPPFLLFRCRFICRMLSLENRWVWRSSVYVTHELEDSSFNVKNKMRCACSQKEPGGLATKQTPVTGFKVTSANVSVGGFKTKRLWLPALCFLFTFVQVEVGILQQQQKNCL